MSLSSMYEAHLSELGVPAGKLRDAVLALASVMDAPDSPGHMAAASAGLMAVMDELRQLYGPAHPLRDELDILRGQKHLRELRERGELDDR